MPVHFKEVPVVKAQFVLLRGDFDNLINDGTVAGLLKTNGIYGKPFSVECFQQEDHAKVELIIADVELGFARQKMNDFLRDHRVNNLHLTYHSSRYVETTEDFCQDKHFQFCLFDLKDEQQICLHPHCNLDTKDYLYEFYRQFNTHKTIGPFSPM